MTPLTLHLDSHDALELDTLATLAHQEPAEIARIAVLEYIRTHSVRSMQARATMPQHLPRATINAATDVGTTDAEQRQRLRSEAKARLAREDIGPVKLVLDGVEITDGMAYQRLIRAQW